MDVCNCYMPPICPQLAVCKWSNGSPNPLQIVQTSIRLSVPIGVGDWCERAYGSNYYEQGINDCDEDHTAGFFIDYS